MATRSNRFFNNPEFARIASNLSGMFAPPSAGDTLAYERAASERQKAQRMSELWNMAGGDFDRSNIAAGNYAPSQSYYSVDQSNQTARRGQDIASGDRRYDTDVGARTTIATNDADNAAALTMNRDDNRAGFVNDRFNTPLNPGQTMPNVMDEESALIESVFGLDPGSAQLGSRTGLPQTPSETEVRGSILQGMTPQDQRAIMGSDVDLVEIIGGNGEPTFQTPIDAIGQEAYQDRGGQAAPKLYGYQTPDGRRGSAIFDPNTQELVDANTRQPLPQGSQTFEAQGEDVGAMTGATTSNQTAANQVIAESNFALERIGQFRQLLEQNPGIMGAPGQLRRVAQTVGQMANEWSSSFGTDSLNGIEDVQRLAESVTAGQPYDPAYRQAVAMALEMAYMDAKMQDPSGEVNVRELERLLSVYDGGIMSSNADVLSPLDALQSRVQQRRDIYAQQLRDPGNAQPTQPGAPSFPGQGISAGQPAPAPAGGPQPGAVEDGYRFRGGDPADPNNWEAVQ